MNGELEESCLRGCKERDNLRVFPHPGSIRDAEGAGDDGRCELRLASTHEDVHHAWFFHTFAIIVNGGKPVRRDSEADSTCLA